MSGNLSFDATAVAPQASFTPIPAGTYQVAIVDSEVKPTKNSGGTMAVFTLQVTDGQYMGRKVFARINVRNANPEAERIGQSQLSSLCHAAGVLQLQDTAQLHNLVIRARVKVRKDDNYGDSNEVVAFESAKSGNPAATVGQQYTTPAASPQQASPAASAPPWARVA